MGAMVPQITSLTIVYSTVYSAQIKEIIKAPRHWPLCGEFTVTGEFPAQRASNAENVSIWWRHHGDGTVLQSISPACTTNREECAERSLLSAYVLENI